MRKETGCVYLVGAGPGDPGLLTQKGRELIETADVVVFDRLVSEEILRMIPEETERIDVGKNAGNHPVPQENINQILLEQAEDGKLVVRLKGGDPFIFGRGGEELELLAENGIRFGVVPGITSAVAAAAYGGIPVTHRDYCSSVHFITGHARAGKELTIDFEALVRLNGTLVFLMGVSTAGRIAEGLLSAGMDPQMPTAFIENGTRPDQRTFVQPLSEMGETVVKEQIHSPALIVVGKVCSLSEQFGWFQKLPLSGKSFLVTRPEEGASKLADGLSRLGASVTVHPCIRTSPVRPLEIPDGDYDTVVFTSAAGVKSYCEWLFENGQDMRAFCGMRIACIGSATAKALKAYGLVADFVPSVYSGQVLGEEMLASGFVTSESRVLLLRTNLASHDVTDCLEKAGVSYTDIPVYHTELLSWGRESAPGQVEDFDCVTFTSRSCVEGMMAGYEPESHPWKGKTALCIGEKTAEAARSYGFEVVVSEKATIESMIQRAVEFTEDHE